MKKDRILRGVVVAQALCMIVLALAVSVRVLHPALLRSKPLQTQPPAGEGTPGGAVQDEGAAARVGSDVITEQAYEAELKRQYGAEVLRTMLLRKAVRLEAQSDGLYVSGTELSDELRKLMDGYDSEQAYYDAMKEQLGMSKEDVQADTEYRLLLEKIAIRGIVVTDKEVKAYMRAHPDEFKPVSRLRLSWIVCDSEDEARGVLKRAEDGESFSALAETYSKDAYTADSGGDLGTLDEDDPFVDQQVLNTARSLEVGDIGGPVKTDGGWALVLLTERTTTQQDEQAQEDDVRKQLALSRAPSLTDVEDRLLAKYGALSDPEGKGLAPVGSGSGE